jgi:hypothetical protein
MRTEQGFPEQSTINGKWSATFVTYCGKPGDEYVANTCASAAVFATEDDAVAGGARALAMLEQTGKYPNMCELF